MAIEKVPNKMIKKEDVVSKELHTFSFPEYQITVQAENLNEAEKKLKEIINNK